MISWKLQIIPAILLAVNVGLFDHVSGHCTSKGNICQQPGGALANRLGCRMAIPRYFFDDSTKTCKEFTYGGCGGNMNSFSSSDECQQACGGLWTSLWTSLWSKTGSAPWSAPGFKNCQSSCEEGSMLIDFGKGGRSEKFCLDTKRSDVKKAVKKAVSSLLYRKKMIKKFKPRCQSSCEVGTMLIDFGKGGIKGDFCLDPKRSDAKKAVKKAVSSLLKKKKIKKFKPRCWTADEYKLDIVGQ